MAADSLEFFQEVFKHSPPGSVTNIVVFEPTSAYATHIGHHRMPNEIPNLIAEVERLKRRSAPDIYFRASVMKTEAAPGTRGKESDTWGASALYCDLDFYKLGKQMGEVLTELESFPFPPSVAVNSGHGLQIFWLLSEFIEDVQGLKGRIRWLNSQLMYLGADDGVVDLARLMRTPGTRNYKFVDQPKDAGVVSIYPQRVYNYSDFSSISETEKSSPVDPINDEPLPDDFLERVQRENAHAYNLMFSETTARTAGADLNNSGRVDRSRNDIRIAIFLLSMGIPAGQVTSVLKHPTWFSGSKFRESKDYRYVESTVQRALTRLEGSPDRFFDKKTFVPLLLIESILHSTNVISVGGVLYHYLDGRYVPGGERFLQQEAAQRLGRQWRSGYGDEVVKWFVHNAPMMNTLQPPVRRKLEEIVINTRTGMLNVASGQVQRHIPEQHSLAQLPVHYDPNANTAIVDQFVREILPSDCIDAWWEFVGYSLLPDCRYRKALIIFGEKWSGKSTLLDLVIRFLGLNNTISMSLQNLCDSRFGAADMLGRYANVFADLEATEVHQPGKFKLYVAGDRIEGERKFKDAFAFYPTCKQFFSANGPTPVRDPDDAYFDRWLVMRAGNSFEGRADLRKIEQIASPANLSAMLNLACDGLRRLLSNNAFSVSQSMKEEHTAFQSALDSVHAFLCAWTLPGDSNNYIPKSDLLQAFRGWVGSVSRGNMADRTFWSRMRSLMPAFNMSESSKSINGVQTNVYIGRRLRVTHEPSSRGTLLHLEDYKPPTGTSGL